MSPTRGEGPPRLLTLWMAAAVLAAFAPAYGLFRFHDDWTFVDRAARAVESHSISGFITHPLDQHWSPLWHAIEALNFIAAGWESDWFIRTLIALATALSLWTLAKLLRAHGLASPAIALGIGVLAFHPASAAARYSFDTYSQAIADLIVWTTAAAVATRLSRNEVLTPRNAIVIVAALSTALLVKEQALSGFAVVTLMLLRRRIRIRGGGPLGWPFPLIAALAIVAIVFAIVRSAMGVRIAAEGPFSLCFACVPQNAFILGGIASLPVSTLVVFDAFRASPQEVVTIGLAAIAALVVVVVVLSGLFSGGGKPPAFASSASADKSGLPELAACGLIGSWFPVALLAHVGELYVHSSLFWLAVLVACGVDRLRGRFANRAPLIDLAGAAFVIALSFGLFKNLGEMRATGERARHWLEAIAQQTTSLPSGDWLIVSASEPSRGLLDYGLYRLTTPQYLVMTGIEPASIRHAVKDRLGVLLDLAATDAVWRDRYDAAVQTGRAHRLTLSNSAAEVGLLDNR